MFFSIYFTSLIERIRFDANWSANNGFKHLEDDLFLLHLRRLRLTGTYPYQTHWKTAGMADYMVSAGSWIRLSRPKAKQNSLFHITILPCEPERSDPEVRAEFFGIGRKIVAE